MISGRGDYGVRFGHYNILACFKIASPVFTGIDIADSGLSAKCSATDPVSRSG